MKKNLMLLIAAFLITLQAQAQIVITEIMYNPPESGQDSLEYIELYNNSSSTVDLSGWTFTEGVTHTFANGTTLAAGEYLTIAELSSAFESVFGNPPTFQWEDGALTNGGEDIELSDATGAVIDYVDYSNGNPWPSGAAGNGPSLVLCDPDSDNSDPSNWIACTTGTGMIINNNEVFGNPGEESGCPEGIVANDDNLTVASGQTTELNVTENDFFDDLNQISIISLPANANVSVNTPEFTIDFTPDPGFCGTTSFEYSICNTPDCDTATVTVEVICYPMYTIQEVTTVDGQGNADSVEVACELTAVVYGVNTRPSGLQFTIIDDNNEGINVFNTNGNLGYNVTEGDMITVRGTIDQFNGLTEILPDEIIQTSSNNPLVTPDVVAAPSEDTESSLIRINNLELVDPSEWTGMGFGFNVRAVSQDSPLDTVTIRIDNDVDLFNAPAPTTPFNLTGIGGQFDEDAPYTEGYQVQPRYMADIDPIVAVTQADFSSEVSIAPNPVQSSLNIQMDVQFDYIQVYNASGAFVGELRKPNRSVHIPVDHLPAGVYTVSFRRGNELWSTQVVKL